MKSIIVIYDDLFELDRTEITYQGETQLKSIVKSLMADYPESQKAEVYNRITQSLIIAYSRDSHGNLSETERHIRRKPASRKPRTPTGINYPQRMTFWMNDATYARLDKVRGHRATFVRKAVEEKLEREGDPLPQTPPKPEGHPDRRYHRLLKDLPPSVKTFDGRDSYRSPLTIVKTPTAWQVSYGPFSAVPGAPSTESGDLLSALEWLNDWLKRYSKKWIVGKVITEENKSN